MSGIPITDNLTFVRGIICEDVRQEANGKWTLAGVFSGDIAVQEFPANIRLGLYLELLSAGAITSALEIGVSLDDDRRLLINGRLDAKKGEITIPVGSLLVPFPHAGMVRVEIRLDGTDWIEVLSKKIILGVFEDGRFISASA